MITRIDQKFLALQAEGRAALMTYIVAGDPNYDIALEIMKILPKFGADIIELGIPFSDPIADGPIIQKASLRALQSGQTLKKTLDMVRIFRRLDNSTPVVLMGYYNPIYIYGVERFLQDAQCAGMDGLLILDIPLEMDHELCRPASKAAVNFIRLVTPQTDNKRLPHVLKGASGFIYYVSMNGITGQTLSSEDSDLAELERYVRHIKKKTLLPVVVGFGIKNVFQVEKISKMADGLVLGTRIVRAIASTLDLQGNIVGDPVRVVGDLVFRFRSSITCIKNDVENKG
ncbi:MAG: tryptophan synthase alpha chain [Candidatus Tokpelaia sp. JSC161]|jgi:tryptophan synthase alpha chain|nr:MAG: tryptophan synthase alpha chain [Candidatus Tokpelaia sp. JSC161]